MAKHAPDQPAPAMPGKLMNAITDLGGEDVLWVIGKKLEKTDVSKCHNRLSILESQVAVEEFITITERSEISQRNKIAVDVVLLVTAGGGGGGGDDEAHHQGTQLWGLNFTKWEMKISSIYVLITNWWELVRNNSLKRGDKAQVWSFRRSHNGGEKKKKLCFAINVLRN
ncbi:B3 domain-containing protein At1g05920-like [Telopea speciosissima]|uniref:B3 domain-containing protein At1g05920-like n=1 Tax=Telopea speciosissima TaxID=54955 RepID=UPI001CC67B5D|nr:B3 domain-containing protein At1g05920-like [Telopea speciosissima]